MSQQFFKERILPCKNKLFRFALSITSNRITAEDVVQEVLIKMWQHREEWAGINNIEAWGMRMTKNLSIDKLRSKHNRTTELQTFQSPNDYRTPERIVENRDSLDYIKQLIQNLPEKQRQIMHLRDIEEFSYKEISDTLELSLSHVKTYLFRARSAVRSQLIKAGLHE